MPLKLKNAKPWAPRDRIEVLGISTPVISSLDELPLGVQAEAADLMQALGSGSIGPTQWAVRMWCLATQLNRQQSERVTWAQLNRQTLDQDDETELITGALEVVKPLIDKLTAAQAEEPTESDELDPKAEG